MTCRSECTMGREMETGGRAGFFHVSIRRAGHGGHTGKLDIPASEVYF
ncbi:MAG: hypothetical protein JRK53_01150 [Deltaproteobacteria bacterium]|nr:hypothetical protein [Deltaproteobacteria bacterium]MBW1815628.1 hypothetical protein [Deltaproteobacteria bacterium]